MNPKLISIEIWKPPSDPESFIDRKDIVAKVFLDENPNNQEKIDIVFEHVYWKCTECNITYKPFNVEIFEERKDGTTVCDAIFKCNGHNGKYSRVYQYIFLKPE